jgi:peptidase M1-like protein/type IX secretion system substrate protein
MKRIIPFFTLLILIAIPNITFGQPIGCMEAKQKIKLHPPTAAERAMIQASNERSDTIDVLNYEITLDVIAFSSQTIKANCIVTFSPKMDNVDYLALDLLDLDVDSVTWNGAPISYDYDGILLEIHFPIMLNSTDTESVTVYYQGTPTVDPSGFGGFDFNNGYAYNLGIGLSSNPYNFGRSWFPCFDNFVERSTYDFNIISQGVRKGYCVGTFMGQTTITGDTIMRRYELDQPIPTYLAGVAISNYSEHNEVHMGAYGPVDVQLVSKTNDLNDMIATFATVTDAIDAIEYWYGPYVWDRVGFVSTVQGAMEHPGNIAYPDFVGLGGDDFAHKRLMSHEFTHCWFGDMVTLSTPADMWFKEGNAEYGAHLFTEYLLGQEPFIDQVKDNFLNEVLKSAHFDDDGFQPLSGIPYEHTYGTHTYRKGASMIHNLRGYLGDSLFRIGQQQVLNTFIYSAVTAEMYRDELIAATGETDKLTSFFDDWIYAPGFAGYEIDSVFIEPSGSEYEATVHVQQKLRAAPHFHTNTPIEITFMDNDWNRYTTQIIVSGEFTTVDVLVPFEPEIWFLNGNGKLNIAKLQSEIVVTNPINKNLGHSEFQLKVDEIVDSAYVRVEHYWVAPDEIGINPEDAKISTTHYWHVDGFFPDVFDALGIIKYNGIFQPELDADLTAITEDSLILVYRPYAGYPWTEYPDYTKLIGNPSDGRGDIVINNLQKGDYAFANGDLDIVNTKNIFRENLVDIFPNPATDYLQISGDIMNQQKLNYTVFDIKGTILKQDQINGNIDVSAFTNGMYVIQLFDDAGVSLGVQQFEVLR